MGGRGGAEASERARERYDDEEDETRQTTSASTSTSGEGESDAGANDDVGEDGSLMRLYDAGIRGTHPLPGSLALPKTPASALGKMPAVSSSAATRERETVRFTLEIAEIYFEVGALETIEGTMALYDVQTRTKVSENFHFSWPNAKQSTIAAFTVPAESLTLNIRLLVHFTHLAADEGGIEDKVYTYKDLRKAKVHAEKERQRVLGMEALRQHEAQASRKVSCIGALIRRQHSVSRERGREPEHFQEAEHARVGRAADFRRARGAQRGTEPRYSAKRKCSEMYRVKEAYTEFSLMEAAISSGTSHSLKSHKPIRCKLVCLLNPLDVPAPGAETNAFKFPPGLVHVKELLSFCPRTQNGELDWETAWGGAVDDGLSRDLYVYVKTIDIGKRQDLRVRMQLRDDDLDIDGRGLLAFPSPCGRGLCRESWTAMSRLRSKGGVFYHEARVRLPVRLNPSHHLVLSIFGAQSASTGLFSAGAGEEELLGHSVINLCSQPETLASKIASATTPTGGDLSLVAVRELLPKYLQSNVRTHMPYWEERKECVHVRLRLASTMHTGDVHIGALFAASAAWCKRANARNGG